MQRAQASMLPDGRRLHLQHGPIDLIAEAFGPGRRAAYTRAADRFATVLDELVPELPRLRRQSGSAPPPCSRIGQRMEAAVAPFKAEFLTPMAAVAGAVADEILGEITAGPGIRKAYVNNGGDVAIHLSAGEVFHAAIAATPAARAGIAAETPVRGIATSGWRGRSQSLGIADSVTVLAAEAAMADAAATLIANAVDLPRHPGIVRIPARDLAPDSDLGDRLVTASVPRLSRIEREKALQAGLLRAQTYRDRGLIAGAWLVLQGQSLGTAHPAFLETAEA